MVFLLLFALSVLLLEALMIDKPQMLYLDNKKKDVVFIVVALVGSMYFCLIIALVIIVLMQEYRIANDK